MNFSFNKGILNTEGNGILYFTLLLECKIMISSCNKKRAFTFLFIIWHSINFSCQTFSWPGWIYQIMVFTYWWPVENHSTTPGYQLWFLPFSSVLKELARCVRQCWTVDGAWGQNLCLFRLPRPCIIWCGIICLIS